jgi:FOG: FHA domain
MSRLLFGFKNEDFIFVFPGSKVWRFRRISAFRGGRVMTVSLKLTCLSGMRDGETIQVQVQEVLAEAILGRAADCTVSLPEDPELSRRHARLVWNSQTASWRLEDLNSTNGTYLGEFRQARRIGEPVALTYGEVFRVGRTCFRLDPPASLNMETAAVAYAQAGDDPFQPQKSGMSEDERECH